MKKLLLLSCLLLPVMMYGQQNHVPNCSFEDYTTCPTGHTQITFSTGWQMYTTGTSDYFNACATGTVDIPVNTFGYQQAAHGQAYAGGATSNAGIDYKEYIARDITPLVPGTIYEVSILVSLANNSGFGTNDLGVFFYDNGPINISGIGTLSVTPQVSYTSYGPITDTQDWVRLSKLLIADSAYDNIVIGGFLHHNNQTRDTINSSGNYAYYYIDSVVIKKMDSLMLNPKNILLCAGDTIDIPFYSTQKKQSNNVFTIQLSNASGSFATPVNLGTLTHDTSGTIKCAIPASTSTGTGYKIRIIASNYPDTADYYYNLKIGNTAVAKPVASNNSPVCLNDAIRLFANSTTQGVTYTWAGPNNFTSSQQNPVIHTPTPIKQGNYVVTASVYGCMAKDTTNVVISGGNGPGGTLASGNGPICVGDTLRLFGTANGSGNNYTWTGPNGFTSNQQNPIIPSSSLLVAGNYLLQASNGGCATTDVLAVVIKPRPENFNAVYNSPVCEGTQVLFSATSTSTGVTYTWSGPNSFVYNGATPTIGAAGAVHNGHYIVTGTINGCSLKDTVIVNVKPTPAIPTAANNAPLCEGEPLNLTGATTTTGVTYGWTGPNSYTSGSQNPTITNTTTAMSGNYIVTATLDGCSSSATTTVLVKPMPAAVTVSSNSPVCEGSTLQLLSTSSTTGVTYNWTGPNNFTANTQNSSVTNSTTAATGWYKMNVDLNGCIYKDSITVTVNPIPATPVITYNSPLCAGETLTLNGGNISGGTYSWTGANNYTSAQSIATRTNMQTADAGIYKANVTVNGCTSPEGTVTVSLNPAPFVVIFSNPSDSICQGAPAMFTAIPNNHGGTPVYQWMVNNQPVATGLIYTTTTLNDQDVIRCDMTENTKCSVPYKDASNEITMTILPWLAPTVSITANPTTPLKENQYVTFTATPVNAGVFPTYQWKRNGQNIIGATGSTWSANTLSDNDNITVVLTSSYQCPQPLTASSNSITVTILTGVNDIDGITGLTLYPNPNNGSFIIKGIATLYSQEEISMEVINSVGQVMHHNVIKPQERNWQQEITLDAPAGVYMLQLQTANGTQNIKFNIDH